MGGTIVKMGAKWQNRPQYVIPDETGVEFRNLQSRLPFMIEEDSWQVHCQNQPMAFRNDGIEEDVYSSLVQLNVFASRWSETEVAKQSWDRQQGFDV